MTPPPHPAERIKADLCLLFGDLADTDKPTRIALQNALQAITWLQGRTEPIPRPTAPEVA